MLKINGIDSWTMQKGKSFFPQDVRITLDSVNRVVAGVKGSYVYQVEINRENLLITGACTCPAYDNEGVCKHIAALWLHLPPRFLSASDSRKTYFFENDFYDDWEEDDEEIDFRSLPPVRQEGIKEYLSYLDMILTQRESSNLLDDFYEKNVLEVVFQLGLNVKESLELEIKCRQLLKNGTFGKIKSFQLADNSLARIPETLREFLVRDPYSRSAFISIPPQKVHLVMPGLIKSKKVYDELGRKVEWLDSILELRLAIDSGKRVFQIKYYFSDKIERRNIAIDFHNGYGLCEEKFFLLKSSLSVEIYDLLRMMEHRELTSAQWKNFQKLITQNLPSLVEGDKFKIETEIVIPDFSFHFRYFSPEHVEVIAVKESRKSSDSIIVEDLSLQHEIEEYTGVKVGESFVINHEKLHSLMMHFNEKGIEFRSNRKRALTLKSYSLQVQGKIDWFETSLHLEVDGVSPDASEILKAIQQKGQFVTLKTGEEILLPEGLQKKLSELAKFSSLKDGKILTHKTRSILLDEWNMNEINADEQFLSFQRKLSEFKHVTPQNVHRSFKANLRDYQKLGLGWMEFLQNMGMGGCLADDMGLGKTVQVLSLLHKRKKLDVKNGPSLIVCPKSLIFNWQEEVKKFAPEIRVNVFLGGKWDREYLDCDILLMSFAMVQRNIEDLKDLSFDYIVLDEAQAIKNPSSLTAKSCYLLKGQHRLALTGTPIENHAGDLMSIFNFLIPGCFSSSMMKDRLTNIEDLKFLRPFILRRKKEEVLKELPPKTDQVIYCDQTEDEKRYYQKLKELVRKDIQDEDNKIQILTALMRLRQASCHRGLIDSKLKQADSGKFEVLKEMVEEVLDSGNKVLIFSQFTELLKLARSFLGMDDSNSAYLDGASRNRQKLVNDFKSDENKKCFFISLKAGGTGLNLTEANYCFILDPWWNPAVENQAIDRIHRIGQTLPVNAYRLISKDTIEEKVLELQAMKAELAKNFMESNEDFIRKLGPQDLNFLFS